RAVHAQLRVQRDGVTIEAVAGERLVINGRRSDSHLLEQNDIIDIGSVRLRFEMRLQNRRTSGVSPGPASNQRMRSTLDALARFAEDLASSYEIDRVLETMLDQIIEVTDASRGVVMLLVDDKPQVKAAREAGGRLSQKKLQISDSIVQRVLKTREAAIISDALNSEFQAAQSVMDYQLCSVLCVPLMVRGELLGVVYLGNDNVVNLFTDEARDVATVFATQAAMVLRNAILIRELQLSNESLTQQIQRMNFGSLIGASPSMQSIFKKIDKVAKTDVSVLIEGETGTGKELVAAELHRRSPRVDGPFVVINCGAIPENLLESELFGHVKGAFTGAVANRDGKFQQADGGSLFLDELGEMPLSLQVKLLRVLEDRKVTRIGEGASREIDIRVVAATNRNLAQEVKSGNFREDLYYRLNVVRLELAPLRDRGDDVELLGRYFLNKYCDEMGTQQISFDEEALRAMRIHLWPGNIRELENRIKKAVIFADSGAISAADLDLEALTEERILPLNEAKERYALGYVKEILDLNAGNRTKTATDLEVDVRTIFRYLEKDRVPDNV
ncbi:MAG TPA: Fis family transcriptional regulator, partial [Myxococcales bacterium]|nr:Fis family transcriptional regulator [Myxococcales bacterium]